MSQRLVAKPAKSFKPSLVKRKPKPVAPAPTAEAATPIQNDTTPAQPEKAIDTPNEQPREASVRPEQPEASPAPQSSAQIVEPSQRAPLPIRSSPRIPSPEPERSQAHDSQPEPFRQPSAPREPTPVQPIRQPSPPRAASPQVAQTRRTSETPQPIQPRQSVTQPRRPAQNARQEREAIEVESAPATQQTQQPIPYNEPSSPAQPEIPEGLREFANLDADRIRAFNHMNADPESALAMLANTAFDQSQPEASTSALPEPAEEAPQSKKCKAKEKTGKKKKARTTEDGQDEPVKGKGKGKKKDGPAKKRKKKGATAEDGEEAPETFEAPAKKRKLGATRTAAERRADQLASDDSGFDTETREAEKAKKKKKKKAPRQAVEEPLFAPASDEEGNDNTTQPPETAEPAEPSRRMQNAAKRKAKKKPAVNKKIAPLPPPTVAVATSAPAPNVPRHPTATPQPETNEDFLDWDEPILIQEEDYQPFIEASPEPEPEPEEEEAIDPETATMASLVQDPGVGRVSQKWLDAQQEKEEAKAKRKAYLKRKKESIFGSDFEEMEKSDEEGEGGPRSRAQSQAQDGEDQAEGEDQPQEEVVDDEQPEEQPEEEYHESHAVVGYRLVDGQMVVDADTLQVDRQAEDLDGDIVDEALGSRRVNSSTYSKRTASARWTAASTEKFYEAIQQNGSDFAMIALYFREEGRTRAQIKSKWKREEKINSHRITEALNNRKSRGDLAALSEQFGLDLSGPTPEDPLEPYYFDKPGGPSKTTKKSSQTPVLGEGEEQQADDTLPAIEEDEEPLPDQVDEPIEEIIEEEVVEE